MLKNHIKIAWRNLQKNKMYACIKIGGFAIGISACLLITLFIKDELSFDQHFPDAENIYRVTNVWNEDGKKTPNVNFPAPYARTVVENCPNVLYAARINPHDLFGAGTMELRRPDQQQSYYETGLAYADQDLIHVLDIPFIYGNQKKALSNPNTIVLSKSKAEKYFPGINPVGKTLVVNNKTDNMYTVGGVMADFPTNSHLHYDFFITLTGVEFGKGEQNRWFATNYITYLKLHPNTNVKELENQLDEISDKYFMSSLIERGFVKKDEAKGLVISKLQPVTDIYLHSEGIRGDGLIRHGDIQIVWIFGSVALFILLLACINFINLSTAKANTRVNEIGLRKTIGSNRETLISQFLTESIMFSTFSFLLGIVIASLFIPFFNSLTGKSLTMPLFEPWFLPSILLALCVLGVLSGLYPSLYLSSFKPASVLKKSQTKGFQNTASRNGLIIFQFAASIILIISTLAINSQMNFILNKDLGFNKDQVLLLYGTKNLGDRASEFKQELLSLSAIKNVSVGDYLPIEGTKRNSWGWWKDGKQSVDVAVSGQLWVADEDYIPTMGMKIVEGRNFSSEFPTDNQGIIINQTMKKQLGLEDPIGKNISNSVKTYTILGVMEDFHYTSLKEEIRSLALTLGKSSSIISIRAESEDYANIIRFVTALWNDFSSNQEMRYSFLDEEFAMMYSEINRVKRTFASLSVLALIVASLGLFGLISFTTIQRRKEIGVRKINGAKVSEILALLNKDFLIWVSISFIIACPVAYYAMHKWLENFAYKTSLNWWIFALAGALALGIALLTVGWQSWRAATRNPVEALRYE